MKEGEDVEDSLHEMCGKRKVRIRTIIEEGKGYER